MRIGVYNLYWTTYGGGEQVAGAIAEVLSHAHEVDVLGPEPVDIARMQARLGVDLSRCGYRTVVDDPTASESSRGYDAFITTTYLSKAVNHAPIGLYYAHFPEEGRTPVDVRRERVGRWLVPLLDRRSALPRRVQLVRDQMAAQIPDRSFLTSYQSVIANSSFTARWIREYWGVEPDVLYPAVRMLEPLPKRNVIASVGRFFAPEFGHCKKQLDLVAAFRDLHRSGRAEGWEYHLVGGCDRKNREYFNAVRRAAIGLPVELHLNASGQLVQHVLGEASLFWHGGGYGEDLDLFPHRAEHFGIAVVEAMSAGAVPIVFGAAGPSEIVRHGIDGLHWRTPEELVAASAGLVADGSRRSTMAGAARERATQFDTQAFSAALTGILERTAPPTRPGSR